MRHAKCISTSPADDAKLGCMRRDPLPIDDALPRLLAALRERGAAVLRAPTGAGKTTRVPPAIVEAGLAGDGLVVMLEPRRVAARAAARRMALEHGTPLGDVFGYQVRFDRKAGPRTRVLVVTPGVLLRRLHDDPFLDGVACVVFDEFHERGLDADLALGMVRLVRENVPARPPGGRDVGDGRAGAGVGVPRRLPGRRQRGPDVPGRGAVPRAPRRHAGCRGRGADAVRDVLDETAATCSRSCRGCARSARPRTTSRTFAGRRRAAAARRPAARSSRTGHFRSSIGARSCWRRTSRRRR